MSKFIPFPFYAESAPIDISFVFEKEKPAGKHGFLRTNGNKFEFEDGTEVRFWGTNLNGGANFPPYEYSEKLAKRLAAIGINLIRLHQLDSEWNTPNIYSFTKGKRVENTRELDPESMRRLDYLIYCMKQEGIYCYMDMITYRKFKSGDGVEAPELLKDAAKPYLIYTDKMIELQKEFADMFWNHVNEFTKIAYKDDPVFVMTEIANEVDLFWMDAVQKVDVEPYATDFRNKMNSWLCENGIEYDAYAYDISKKDDDVLNDFRKYLQEKYYTEMKEYMRSIGVKIPITGNNWRSTPDNTQTQLMMDFTDAHSYHYEWRWGEYEKYCWHNAITHSKNTFLTPIAQQSVGDMPHFISEWDMPWPNAYRAESPIFCAAVGLHSGWSGFAIHTYAYSSALENMNMLGKEVSSTQIGGVPYREGIFSTWNDPAKFGLFYHAALMTRRGDIMPANEEYAVNPPDRISWNDSAFDGSIEKSKVYTSFDKENPMRKYTSASLVCDDLCEVTSDTGQLYRNWNKNYGTVDSPMTKCAYGFLKKNGEIKLDGMSVNAKNDFAVVALSSLDDNVIKKSTNMLLTTVGRAVNTDFQMEDDKLINYGKAPVIIEVIEAEIEIKTDVSTLSVWGINAEGFYIGKVPSCYENGKLKFTVGETSQTMYYLIVAE